MNTLQQAVNIWYSSSNTTNIIIVLLMLLTVIFLFFLVPYLIVEIKKRNKIKEEFFKKAKEYGLTDLEAELLWRYSSDYRWNIALVFNNKKVFEIVASKILNNDTSFADIINQIRHKLGFDHVPWFLPISTTKDIELYQSGKILFNERQYDAVVWDKDEKYIYLALYNINKSPIKIGDVITFSFITQDYVQTSFSSKVVGISEDSGRILYKVEHSDKVVRVPIRDAVRIELSLKAYIYIPTAEELEVYEKEQILPEPEEDKFIEGVIKDLSIGGTRFCTSVSLSDLQKVFVKFRIYDKDLIIFGTIRNKFDAVDHFCYGIKFENITKEQEEDIRSYIIEQQRLLVKSYKLGEL
ncbi:MAG: flagellar brake protein [Hydrogenobaculum sp.]